MASNGASEVPAGQSSPLSIITQTDKTGVVLIVTSLGLIFALISLFIRAAIRFEFRQKFGRDDVAVAAAMVSILPMRHNLQHLITDPA